MPTIKRRTSTKRKSTSKHKSAGLDQRSAENKKDNQKRRETKSQRTPAFAAKYATAAPDPSIDNLAKIDHIVVLMMENRSFDHMLGYLKLEGGRQDIDGLIPGLSNTYNDKPFPIHHLPQTKLGTNQDPCHAGSCVADQLRSNNGGFVKNYGETHKDDPDAGLVMGFYNKPDLPAYDYLAAEFCVCDQWFASVPGATWPNRLYALTGRADGSKDNPPGIPKYNQPSFVRHLDRFGTTWGWYAFPLPIGGLLTTLQIADGNYSSPSSGNYAKFDPNFLSDASHGALPAVSWIDPDFGLSPFGHSQNDDHPPADIAAGQALALEVYHAVTQGPLWNKTLLIIVYDEHGGFYDHVPPVVAPDDDPNFRSFGVRVPAIVVSPWVARQSVSKIGLDHTSIIKTILLRFCRQPDGTIPDMGARVTAANHLGSLLTEITPRPPRRTSNYQATINRIAAWHGEVFKKRFQDFGVRQTPPQELTEFQRGLLAAAVAMSRKRAR